MKAMKRLISLAILGFVALAPLASGQMRGGGMGSGRSSGFSRGSAAPARVGGAAFAPRPMGAAGVGVRGGVVGARTVAPSGRVFVTTTPFPHRFHNGRVVFNNGRFFNCGFGFPCSNRFVFGNPFFFGSGFGWGWPLGYSGFSDYPAYPADYYPQAQAPAASDNSGNVQLAVEIQRLSDEVEDLRNETRQAAAARPPGGSWSTQEPGAAATFAFRDGRLITTHNYAIAGQTLWIFSENTAHKYALTELDRAKTEQVNAASGVELHLPEAR